MEVANFFWPLGDFFLAFPFKISYTCIMIEKTQMEETKMNDKKKKATKITIEKATQVLNQVAKQIGPDMEDDIEVYGEWVSKDIRKWDYFTDRCEDDDWAEFTSQAKVEEMVKTALKGVKGKFEFQVNDSEKKWFSIRIKKA